MPDKPKPTDPRRRLHDFHEAIAAMQVMMSPNYGEHLGGLMKGDSDPERKVSYDQVANDPSVSARLRDAFEPIVAAPGLADQGEAAEPFPDPPPVLVNEAEPVDTLLPTPPPSESNIDELAMLDDIDPSQWEQQFEPFFGGLDYIPRANLGESQEVARLEMAPKPDVAEEIHAAMSAVAQPAVAQPLNQPANQPVQMPPQPAPASPTPPSNQSKAPWLSGSPVVSPNNLLGVTPPQSPATPATGSMAVDHSANDPIIIRDPAGKLVDRQYDGNEYLLTDSYREMEVGVDAYTQRVNEVMMRSSEILMQRSQQLSYLRDALASEGVDERL